MEKLSIDIVLYAQGRHSVCIVPLKCLDVEIQSWIEPEKDNNSSSNEIIFAQRICGAVHKIFMPFH
jgi:hypothetical protein